MSNPRCKTCQKPMVKYGKTAGGKQRYRCSYCRSSTVKCLDSSAKRLAVFLSWLLSSRPQDSVSSSARTLRRYSEEFWPIWPLMPPVEIHHDIIFCDAIHLGRKAVVLIAMTTDEVLGWYMAKAETSGAYTALFSRIAAPAVFVCDGAGSIESARAACWPDTAVQRCLFHIHQQVVVTTTRKPQLPASKELYTLSKELLHITTLEQARSWISRYQQWSSNWTRFTNERSRYPDGTYGLTHPKLHRTRIRLDKLVKSDVLFTYLDPQLPQLGYDWRTNNYIESANAQIRAMLRAHRGMKLSHQVRAIGWWCLTRSSDCPPPAQLLRMLPTDKTIEAAYRSAWRKEHERKHKNPYGTELNYTEFHTSAPWLEKY